MKTPIYYDSRLVKVKNYFVMVEHHCYDCYAATVSKETPNFEILPAMSFCLDIGEPNPKLFGQSTNYKKAAEKAIEMYEQKIKKEMSKC